MSCILFAWEMGSNYGHLTRDLPLARLLRDQGHKVVMAVPNLRLAWNILKHEGLTIVQSPILRSNIERSTAPINYPDLLIHEGYDDAVFLNGAVHGWKGLLEILTPSLVVFNHAPTALIAARILDIPVMMIGTGFEIPPQMSPMPSFRPMQNLPSSVLAQPENFILDQIRPILASYGKQITTLSQLFYDSKTLLSTFSELDPFGPRPSVEYIGSVFSIPNASQVEWQTSKPVRIFVYLRTTNFEVEKYLSVLNKLNAEVICSIPGAPPDWVKKYSSLKIITNTIDLSELLNKASGVVTYGPGTLATALLAGVPVLLIPQMQEQYLTGLRLESIGAGFMLNTSASEFVFFESLKSLIENPQYRQSANLFSQKYRQFNSAEASNKLLTNVYQKLHQQ